MSGPTRAVLFDFGGTLYDYETLAPGDRECLIELARRSGATAPEEAPQAHRTALRRVFREYLPRPYYSHAEMFRDAAAEMLRELGADPHTEHLATYREMQWRAHRRDFRLREGVEETLGEIRRRGLHLGIVSNIDEDQLSHLGEIAGLGRHFDSLLSSERARSCKPDTAIFHEALRRAGCRPEEALFVGDSLPADVAGANRVGLRSVLLWHRPDRAVPAEGAQPRHVIRRIPDLLDLL